MKSPKTSLVAGKKGKFSIKEKEVQFEEGLSKKGVKIIIFSVLLLAIGFLLLKFTNPEGDNWASFLSPVIIIISYILIGIGIMVK